MQIRSLEKRFGAAFALHDVTFKVPAGAITGLIGPNGAGKTTVLECIAGILDPSGGTVTGAHTLFYLPESVRPWPEQRVADALRFFRDLHSVAVARCDAVIRSLALDSLLQNRIGRLSKGEHRRLLLALALFAPHPFLLLDEPFDGLDLRQTRGVMALLREEVANGRSFLLSIHQLGDAQAVCDHLVLLSNGAVVGEGSMSELRERIGNNGASLDEVFLALT